MGDPLDDVMEGQGRTRKDEFIHDNSFGVSKVLLAQQKYQQNINKRNNEQNINKVSTSKITNKILTRNLRKCKVDKYKK